VIGSEIKLWSLRRRYRTTAIKSCCSPPLALLSNERSRNSWHVLPRVLEAEKEIGNIGKIQDRPLWYLFELQSVEYRTGYLWLRRNRKISKPWLCTFKHCYRDQLRPFGISSRATCIEYWSMPVYLCMREALWPKRKEKKRKEKKSKAKKRRSRFSPALLSPTITCHPVPPSTSIL